MEIKILAGCELSIKCSILKNYTYAGPDCVHLLNYVMTKDAGCSARRPKHRCQHLDQGALACAIWAQKAKDLSLLDFQSHIVNSPDTLECLA